MKIFFSLLYIFSIVSYFLIGQLRVPGLPINLNILSTILLFFACVVIEKPKFDKWMVVYLVFLLFYVFSALVTGFLGVFVHRLYSMFFISFVIYWATCILTRRFGTLSPMIYPVLVVGAIDVFVTVSQANGYSIANPFLTMVIADIEQDAILAAHGYELGYAVSGLYYSPVLNGHFLLFFFLVTLLLQYDKFRMSALLFSIVLFVGIFYCQQRSAFFFSVFAFVAVFYYKLKNSRYRLLLLVAFVIIVFVAYGYISNYIVSSGSRLSQTTGTGRELIWSAAIDFIYHHPFFGGYDLCVNKYGFFPHNLVLSSFIAGGLIGGTILLVMIGSQFLYIIRQIRLKKEFIYLILGIIYLCIIGDSMFHNTGLVEMDYSTFIAWGLFSTIMKNDLSPNMSLIKRK